MMPTQKPKPPTMEEVAGQVRRHGIAVSARTLTRILTGDASKDGRLVQGSLRKLEREGAIMRTGTRGKPGRYAPAKW